ncbi:hypothetical protein BCR33DRAFT_714532 [Rhizoclosmatium globosum]|uniref:Arrestin-like N-terminal domain-containing protein n=1 Tax=Rhizoclosmatium globosum TaxID=329046 RepID=A0A1Y2CM63_9FUNG|nr:hypothetical protein BCR33DRAFT_714532 [Rhizoclosmatium globosum]|eukprot:ORY48102.1 hypothetical protein BCR33DRAFT_714532 [Rhizoclosmatium globosum]
MLGPPPAPLERFEVVGRGDNWRASDNAIVVDAGWNTDSTLDCAVLLSTSSKLKSVRIQAEFRAYVETRWEGLSTLATKPAGPDYKPQLSGRVFQQLVQVVYDSKDPIEPPASGKALLYPFRFNLPQNNMPPTFDSIGGTVHYYIKCSILFSEAFKLLKTNYEIEVPVIVGMPEAAKVKLLQAPSQLLHPFEPSDEKVGCTVQMPRRIVQMGDTMEVNIAITSTPGDARIRSLAVSLRTSLRFLTNQQHLTQARGAQAPVARPLCELNESFNLVKVGGEDGVRQIVRQIPIYVDPTIAQVSFESPLISVKTIFRLQIILDDSETPNISYEVPVVVLPRIKDGTEFERASILQRSKSQGNVRMNRISDVRPRRNDSLSAKSYQARVNSESQRMKRTGSNPSMTGPLSAGSETNIPIPPVPSVQRGRIAGDWNMSPVSPSFAPSGPTFTPSSPTFSPYAPQFTPPPHAFVQPEAQYAPSSPTRTYLDFQGPSTYANQEPLMVQRTMTTSVIPGPRPRTGTISETQMQQTASGNGYSPQLAPQGYEFSPVIGVLDDPTVNGQPVDMAQRVQIHRPVDRRRKEEGERFGYLMNELESMDRALGR